MRGKGEGSVYRRADGYWVGQIEAGRYPSGRRRYARVVRRYKADVIEELPELKRSVAEGVVPDRTTTVSSYLDFWLTDVIRGQVSDSSYKEYEKRLRRVKPQIGHVKLGKLTPAHIQALVNHLAEKYPRSPKTRSTTLDTLRQALKWAVAAGMRSTNPAEHVQGPKSTVAKIDDALDADEAKAVLNVAEGDRLYGLVWLALKYGLRIGELLNLRWNDVDLTRDEMTVRRSSTKTDAGHRTLPLIEDARRVLQAHRKQSDVSSIDGYVFTLDGAPLSPQRTRLVWSGFLQKAGIAHLCRNCGSNDRCSSAVRRFHSSRHTAATLLLEAGVELEVVSAILGHANIGITADIYAKVRNDLKRKGLEKLA
jgi:integrase